MEPDKRKIVGCFHVHDNITLLVNVARIVKIVSSFEKFNWKGGIRSRRIIVPEDGMEICFVLLI